MRVMIVDDEPLARELLRRMLEEDPAVQVVAELGSGRGVAEAVAQHAPDVLFLDIQMPGQSGLDVAAALPAERMPVVIFVTAYDQYAVRAFDLHALDYLLKPLDPERLAEAVRRARVQLARPGRADEIARIMETLEQLRRREEEPRRLALRVGERTYLKRVEEVERIQADGKFVQVHVEGTTYAMRETMTNMLDRLPAGSFVRVSRSEIVNLDHVREIQPWFNGDYVLILRSGAQVTSTRGYRDGLRALLER